VYKEYEKKKIKGEEVKFCGSSPNLKSLKGLKAKPSEECQTAD
jgi:hypothetical protein